MAKKRKHAGPAQVKSRSSNTLDEDIGPIRSYEDVADSEDEFHMNRDRVLLDEGPETKRRRRQDEGDAFIELSDEEVLGYSESEDALDEDEDEVNQEIAVTSGAKQPQQKDDSNDEGNEREDEDVDAGGWGSSKKDYYDADNIETEADALEEEAEAKRLQQKKLQKFTEADFGFDEDEWLDNTKDENDADVVTEVLKEVEITADMGQEERDRIFQVRYPEFEFLANEYLQLQPLLADLEAEAASTLKKSPSRNASNVAVIKGRALAAYLGALTMYFAILTSTAKDDKASSALDPSELRDHTIMDSLLRCRELWAKVQSLKSQPVMDIAEDVVSEDEVPEVSGVDQVPVVEEAAEAKKSRRQLVREAAAAEAAKARAHRIRAAETELADLDDLISKPTKRQSKSSTKTVVPVEDDSDFGEEESLSARALAEKAQRKKSLRFYTSQIAQKANRRADAGRDAGGDADLPYRERFRDRQARLNSEAEKRGKKLDEYGRGADLGGDSEDEAEDAVAAAAVRDDDDEYYDVVTQMSSKRKGEKAEKYAAIAAAKAAGSKVRVVEGEVGEDGKRAIGYVIEKNKGLAPKRKKDVRNPRVKKRKKYEEKLKKLSSTRAVYKGGEGRGGYGGEATGIKTGLIKSVKL
ncbi:MAG: hypothetical protein M1818_000003 [Claussenomyces sp. TS43310]|nr:MAG: hypothetical protein M1818_000003 [Claussenomyces sp. TS43310]